MEDDKTEVIGDDVKLIPEEDFEIIEEERGGPVFVPQLYLQRYFYVQQELQRRKVQSVVDFGSAELKISRFLVRIPTVEKVALVDIDGPLLEKCKHETQPLLNDYIRCRNNCLKVNVFEGSITQLDEAVCGYEAVSMVEIIEHLYPDVLESACDMVFGGLQPKVAIVTTPNADYNELFPNFSGFRHWDHKFEWTRKEFQQWAAGITQKFPYEVEFSGVGNPTEGSEHLGFCSQIAIFTFCASHTVSYNKPNVTKSYKLVLESTYPGRQTAVLTEEDSLIQEVEYLVRQISRCGQCDDEDVQYEENVKCHIPISYFLKFEKFKKRFDVNQFRTFLQDHGYRLSVDGLSVIIPEDSLSDYSDHDSLDVELSDNLSNVTTMEQKTLIHSGVNLEPNHTLEEHESENWG